MPHADSSLIPSTITTKPQFWAHVYTQHEYLLSDQRTWISNLANSSALIYNSLIAFPAFGSGERAVNWCGEYSIPAGVHATEAAIFCSGRVGMMGLIPHSDPAQAASKGTATVERLLLGPFNGKPACQFIDVTPGKSRGVCADAFLQRRTALVPDVNKYPGHIACDGETNSEIVCPLIIKMGDDEIVLGVLDLDCLALGGFDEEDRKGLERIAEFVALSCDW